jgi:hypothetical protein
MKAIYNVTGEVVDIEDMSIVTYKSSDGTWIKTLIKNFTFIDAEKEYYTKLEHQYAGMAMQGILSGNSIMERIAKLKVEDLPSLVVDLSIQCAHALVEKLKESK